MRRRLLCHVALQSVRDKLEVRRSTVETSVRQGRMCRADDQSDEDIGTYITVISLAVILLKSRELRI